MATLELAGEQRIVLHGISWETYERLLRERGEAPRPQLTYDRGELGIVSPYLPPHDDARIRFDLIVSLLAEAREIEVRALG